MHCISSPISNSHQITVINYCYWFICVVKFFSIRLKNLNYVGHSPLPYLILCWIFHCHRYKKVINTNQDLHTQPETLSNRYIIGWDYFNSKVGSYLRKYTVQYKWITKILSLKLYTKGACFPCADNFTSLILLNKFYKKIAVKLNHLKNLVLKNLQGLWIFKPCFYKVSVPRNIPFLHFSHFEG